MKTWEMIKELTEQPNKKFENALGQTVWNNNGFLVLECKETQVTISLNGYYGCKEIWFEIIEPVDFLTAYKDVEETRSDYIDEYNQRKLEFNFGSVHMVYLKEHLVTVGSGIILGNIKWIKQ